MGRILYVALLACLLAVWAVGASANVTLPIYGNVPVGLAFVALGCVLAASGISQNWIVPYPLHAGLVALSVGVSMVAHSAAGLWLITPTVAIIAVINAVHGSSNAVRIPGILPPDDDRRPTTLEGIRFLFVVIIPWLALFEFTTHMGLRGTAFRLPFEDHLPVYAWTAFVYETSYLTVTFAPTWTTTNRQLRQLMITGWVATAIVYPIYWLLPSAAPRRPMVDDSWIAHLLMSERTGVAPTAAFPSFHVLWAIFVGRLWPRWLWIAYSVLIAISCITTGMHYIPDVLAAFAIAPFLLEPHRRIWKPIVMFTERISKSVEDWPTSWAAFASFAAVAIVATAVGPSREWHALVTAFGGLIGILLSSRLGYGRLGAWVALALASACFEDRWTLFAAWCLCAPFIQALERRRAPSLVANVFLGLVLVHLWASAACSLSLICGVYSIGAGMIMLADKDWRIAIATVAVGAVLTTVPTAVPTATWAFSTASLSVALVFAVAASTVVFIGLARGAKRVSGDVR